MQTYIVKLREHSLFHWQLIFSFLKILIKTPVVFMFVFTILFSIFLSFSSPNFLTFSNWMNISRQTAVIGIMALGMNLVILTGGIDLSIGSIMGLSLCIAGTFIKMGLNCWIVISMIIFLAAALGYLNGLIIMSMEVPPIIVTLATLSIYRGIAYIYTKGYWVTGIPYAFLSFGRAYVPLIIWIIIAAIIIFSIKTSTLGRHIYAVGGSEQAAQFCGVNVKRVKLTVYTISGLAAGLGGVIFLGRCGVIQPTAGLGYEFQAIAAIVVGGTSIFGGEGSVVGTVIGALLIGIILNGLTLMGVSAYWQGVVTGSVIISAVALYNLRRIYQ